MAEHVLVTMQVTASATNGEAIADRITALTRECFGPEGERASVSIQPYDPDEAAEDDTCATCGCVIGDAEQHVAWHRSDVRRVAELHAGQRVADEPQIPRCFGEEPAHA
jgi:hypothetical protein